MVLLLKIFATIVFIGVVVVIAVVVSGN